MPAQYRRTFLTLVVSGVAASGCALRIPSLDPSTLEGTPLRPLKYKPFPGDPLDIGPRLNGYGLATVPREGSIVIQGDDTAYGADIMGAAPGINGSDITRTKKPFSDTLSHYLKVRVLNRGYPGDTISRGVARWKDLPLGNLLVVAYGYSDARAKTPIQDFKSSLSSLIETAQSKGSAVILVVPPAYVDVPLSQAAEPFRVAIRNAAAATGANILELQAAINTLSAPQPNILSDPNWSHPKKADKPLFPSPPIPFAFGQRAGQKQALANAAVFSKIADMLAVDVAVSP